MCKRPIGFRENSIGWHTRRKTPSLLASKHRWTNAEPTADFNCSIEFGMRSGKPVHHWHSRPTMRFKVIQYASRRPSRVNRHYSAPDRFASVQNCFEYLALDGKG